MEGTNRPDEWVIEQGLQSMKLPVLDQSGKTPRFVRPLEYVPFKDDDAIKSVGDRQKLFQEERKGWRGYIEWEKCPDKKAKAHKILTSQNFPPPPEFQLGPIPGSNPVLEGVRWKMWHRALGGALSTVPEESWETVLEEKHPEMLHLLQWSVMLGRTRICKEAILTSSQYVYPAQPFVETLKGNSRRYVLLYPTLSLLNSILPIIRNISSFSRSLGYFISVHANPNLLVPYNGEPPKRLVTAKDVTPNALHFIRNHGGIPRIDKDKFDLQLDGLVAKPRSFTLNELKDESKFPRMEQLVTIQCSGTRRVEQIGLYAGEGDEMINAPWAEGAIGTARYVGVSLKKVIKACGGLVGDGKHLELYGADTYFKKDNAMNYLVSVPWSKVKANEVMLALEMNGEPLPKIHGYPLRVVVMGYIGARSVKWLYRIKAIETPSLAPVQSQEYLYFNQQFGKHNQRMTDGIQIQEMPVSSAIMTPWTKQVVIHNGKIHCKGWAYSGGGRWPERVELSADGGFSWYAVPQDGLSRKHKFSWRIWEIDLPCDVEGWIEIVCRCWDNSLNTQPLNVRAAWNWGLHVTSSAHRISVYSVNKTRELTRKRLAEFDERGVPFGPLTVPTEWQIQSWDDYKAYWNKYDPRDMENEYHAEDLDG